MVNLIGSPRIRVLCGAAGHLCSAYDALNAIGADAMAVEVLDLLSSIDAEIASLEEREATPIPP